MAELLSTMAQVTLGPGYQITFEAIDPVSGAPVTGVVVSNIGIGAEDLSGTSGPLDDTFPLLLPLADS